MSSMQCIKVWEDVGVEVNTKVGQSCHNRQLWTAGVGILPRTLHCL